MSKLEVSRRSLAAAVGLGSFASLLRARGASAASPQAGSGRTINICEPPYNADPNGQAECAGIIQSALTALSDAGGGELVVPPGDYVLGFPISSPNRSVKITGSGPNTSVFLVRHNGVALALTSYNVFDSFVIRDIGFSPVASGSIGGIAVSINLPPGDVGWVRCTIENICFGVPRPNYTTFAVGLRLVNCKRANFKGINYHSNAGVLTGTSGVMFTGECIDCRFDQCSIEGADIGFNVTSYSEGITIAETAVICNVGLSTGNVPYNNGLNVNEIFIANCEFNCYQQAANLYGVLTAYLTGTHFGNRNAGSSCVSMTKCLSSQIVNCQMSGNFLPNSPQPYTGVYLSGCEGSFVDASICTNLLTGVYYDSGTIGTSTTGLRMLAPGGGTLVGNPIPVGQNLEISAVADFSGNTTNYSQWISADGPNTLTRHGGRVARFASVLAEGLQ